MNPDREISHLLDLMPASGRMMSKIVSKPEQPLVIDCKFPLPWHRSRPIYINFDLWQQMSRPQRDLLLLRTVSWLGNVVYLKPDIYQGLVALGVAGTAIELLQADAVGIVVAGGLTAIASSQVWRMNRRSQSQLEADEMAIRVAGRRGYNETEAARHLLGAIESVAKIEGRPSLNFIELIRCQNLRAIGNLSPLGVPESIRRD
ncbi:MAG: DUF3318 domain-containing protein [Hormoscilla sp. GUM202]|nr:DUF3318 domain-containing protein [Hormoscilla sp. GUM202]